MRNKIIGEKGNLARNNTAITIALILMFTVASFTIVAPAVLAQGPGTELKTWLLVSASPSPVGVGQPVFDIFQKGKIFFA